MEDRYDLARFLQAQTPVIDAVRRELAAGAKQTHWMWFVFPQLAGLGRSATAEFFAIADLGEARAYLAHPLLGARLLECVALVNAIQNRTVHEVFGSPDDLKFRSSMTLFAAAADDATQFEIALTRCFAGEPDPTTLRLLFPAQFTGEEKS